MCLPAAAFAALGASSAAGTGLLGASMATTLATASGIAGIGMMAVGSYNQAKAQQDQANYAAQVAQNNATIAEYQAQDIERKGDEEASRLRREAAQLAGVQRNRLAAGGLDLSEGTAAELQSQTEFFSLVDQNTARSNAAREAWSKRQQGAQYSADAGMQRATASSISPGMAATTSLLGNAGRVADSWYADSGASGAFADRAGPLGSGSGGRMRTITGGR
jgi:hypothetical protein